MSRISNILGTMSLLASASALAGGITASETSVPTQINTQSFECKVKTIHGGYGDHEREVLTLKLNAGWTLGLLDHTEFSTGAYGGAPNLCAQAPALAASLATTQGKANVAVSYYTNLWAVDNASTSELTESVTFTLTLKDGNVISLSSDKQIQVEKK